MADPAFVDCPDGQWTKIATNVITGIVWRIEVGPLYLQTYRITGNPAPTLQTDGVPIFREGEPDYEQIAASEGIDVYIWCKNSAGRVRVDV